MKKTLLAAGAFLFLGFGLWLFAGASGGLGSDEEPGEIHAASRPAAPRASIAATGSGLRVAVETKDGMDDRPLLVICALNGFILAAFG